MPRSPQRVLALVAMLVIVPGAAPLVLIGALVTAGTDTHVPTQIDGVFFAVALVGLAATLGAVVGLAIGSRRGTIGAVLIQASCAVAVTALGIVVGFPIFEEVPWLGFGLGVVFLADVLALWAATLRV